MWFNVSEERRRSKGAVKMTVNNFCCSWSKCRKELDQNGDFVMLDERIEGELADRNVFCNLEHESKYVEELLKYIKENKE